MGSAFFVVLDSRPTDFNWHVPGKFVARAVERLRSTAARLGVPALEDFYSSSPGELAGLGLEDEPQEPPTELVAGLGLAREPGFLYFLVGGKVQRRRTGRNPAEVETVAEADFIREDGWLYFLNEAGDIVRSPKNWTPDPVPGEPQEQWFDPTAALATFRALQETVAREGDDRLAEDLGEFVRVLEEAAKRGMRFHLAVDF